MRYLIGVDLGTQGTKTALLDETGRTVSEAFEASELLYPEPGAVEQDPEAMLGSVRRTIRRVTETSGVPAGDVAGIGLDGQMAGILGVGRDGLAVTPYDSWLDTRCERYREPFLRLGEEKIIALTGAPVTCAHGPKVLFWKGERPQAYAKIHKFVQPAAYCVMRLCGLRGDEAFIDHTYLHFAGFADTAHKKWSDELLRALGVDADKMPRILRPSDIAGRLTAEMAGACGLLAGTPVVAGCGDTAASSFGAGIFEEGLLFDVAGTASVFSCAVRQFVPDVKNRTLLFAPSVLSGLYTPMAYMSGGGMCLKWFRDDLQGSRLSYRELDALAETVPAGSENLLFIPHFSGRVCPNDPLVRGAYLNLSWRHRTGHLYRAILESIAYEYGLYADILRALFPDLRFQRVVTVGGGSKSPVFTQIKADALDIAFAGIRPGDTAALACCAIAGFGVGLYQTPEWLIENSVRLRDSFTPNPEAHALYAARREIYAQALTALHGIYSKFQVL